MRPSPTARRSGPAGRARGRAGRASSYPSWSPLLAAGGVTACGGSGPAPDGAAKTPAHRNRIQRPDLADGAGHQPHRGR